MVAPRWGALGFSPAVRLGSRGGQTLERMPRASPRSLPRAQGLLHVHGCVGCPVVTALRARPEATRSNQASPLVVSCSAAISPDGGRGLHVRGEWPSSVLDTEHVCMRLRTRLSVGSRDPFTTFLVPVGPWARADPKPDMSLLSYRNRTKRALSGLSLEARDTVM